MPALSFTRDQEITQVTLKQENNMQEKPVVND